MSRLHGKVLSDRRTKDTNIAANENMQVELTWGSANDIKQVMHVSLVWRKGWQRPLLTIDIGDDLEVLAYFKDGPPYVRTQK